MACHLLAGVTGMCARWGSEPVRGPKVGKSGCEEGARPGKLWTGQGVWDEQKEKERVLIEGEFFFFLFVF